MIKSGKPKSIKGNILGSKIAGLTLDPLTKSINKFGKADTNKVYMWINAAGMTLLKLCQSDTTITILKNITGIIQYNQYYKNTMNNYCEVS